jgi:hypothetical protein
MIINFIKSPIGFGYAYKKGGNAASLPDKDCKFLIEAGVAVDITPKKLKYSKGTNEDAEKPKTVKGGKKDASRKLEVQKAVVK